VRHGAKPLVRHRKRTLRVVGVHQRSYPITCEFSMTIYESPSYGRRMPSSCAHLPDNRFSSRIAYTLQQVTRPEARLHPENRTWTAGTADHASYPALSYSKNFTLSLRTAPRLFTTKARNCWIFKNIVSADAVTRHDVPGLGVTPR